MRFIVPIVEGQGDEAAAPVLMRRILRERNERYDIDVLRPKRAKGKGGLVSLLEDFIGYAAITNGCAAILVLLDADDDCPFELGNELARRARSIDIRVPAAVVCAKRKYENWFLASNENFQGDAEEYGDAKDWLRREIASGLSYKETRDQVRFSAMMDIDAAFEASRSFRRLCNAVDELVKFVDTGVLKATPGV